MSEGYKPPEDPKLAESEYALERLTEFRECFERRLSRMSKENSLGEKAELERILGQWPEIEKWVKDYAVMHDISPQFPLGYDNFGEVWEGFVKKFSVDEKKVYDNVQESARVAEAVNAFGGVNAKFSIGS